MGMTPASTFMAIFVMGMCLTALGQPNPDRGPGAPPPGGQRWRMFPAFEGNALGEVVSVLGELNLSPDFTLTPEQKQKIQAIRDDFKNQQEMWRAEHAEELKQLDDRMAELMDGGGPPPEPEQMREVMEARRDLMSTAPDGENEAEQVKALLSEDQLKQFEARRTALEEERQQMRRQFERRGPRRR